MTDELSGILVISSSLRFFETLRSVPGMEDLCTMQHATDISDARMRLLTSDYSVIVINAPLSDGFGFDLAIELASTRPAGVMIFVDKELFEKAKTKGDPYGIVTIPKQTSAAVVFQSLSVLCVTARKMRLYQQKNDELQNEMNDLRLTNRAKLLLMQHFSMTEEDAHKYIEKRAMSTGESKRVIAENIIGSYAR